MSAPVGRQGMVAPRIGLGVMSLAFYGSGDGAADEASSLAAIDALVAACAPAPAFLDTAWVYASAVTGLHSETIVGKAVAKHGRAAFVIATKFGIKMTPTGLSPDSSRDNIHAQYSESVARLGTTPDLYYQHRPDPARDVADVVADLALMVADGRIKYIGLSECTPDELRRAHAVHPVTAIQMEWSLQERGIEAAVVPAARALGVAIVAYSPLARGLLTASFVTGGGTASFGPGDFRATRMPRFQGGALEANAAKAAAVAALAARLGCTPAQLSLAWLLRQGPDVFPIPGSKTPARVEENMGALAVAGRLTDADLVAIEALDATAVGPRGGPGAMTLSYEARMPAAAAAEGK